MVTTESDEAREILRREVATIEQLSWDELDGYEERIREISSDSGRRFRVRTMAYWDMDPWESDMWIVAEASPVGRRVRRKWPYGKQRFAAVKNFPHRT